MRGGRLGEERDPARIAAVWSFVASVVDAALRSLDPAAVGALRGTLSCGPDTWSSEERASVFRLVDDLEDWENLDALSLGLGLGTIQADSTSVHTQGRVWS